MNGRMREKNRRAMPLVNIPARKGVYTRSSGNAERLPEDAERSSGDVIELMSFLCAAMDELRQMREERVQQQRQQEQLVTALRREAPAAVGIL